MADYDRAAQRLAFGESSPAVAEQRIATAQALGGTGALKVAADFLRRLRPQSRVLISDPSWENHRALFTQAGFEVATYPYYDPVSHGVRFDAMLAALNAASADTVVVLHACCHNPTGCDLTAEQWREVVASARARGWIPLLDMAYQGFGQGLDEDAAAVRLFVDAGARMPGRHLVLEELFALWRASGRAVGGVRAAPGGATRAVAAEGDDPRQLLQPAHARRQGGRCRAGRSGAAPALARRVGTDARAHPQPCASA